MTAKTRPAGHTPEWHVEYDHADDTFCEIRDSQNEPIAVIHAGGYRPISEDHNHARLIAASPELLDLCMALADRLRVHSEGKIMPLEPVQQHGWATLLEKAIRKARGE